MNSSSREFYFGGFVTTTEVDDSVIISLQNSDGSSTGSVSYDTTAVFNYATVEVDRDGTVKNVTVDKSGGMDPTEIIGINDNEDETDPTEFDYAIFKRLKGNMNAGFITRIKIVD